MRGTDFSGMDHGRALRWENDMSVVSFSLREEMSACRADLAICNKEEKLSSCKFQIRREKHNANHVL